MPRNSIPRAAMRYRVLAEAMPQLVWATDTQGRVIYLNQRWSEFTGLSEQESCGFGFLAALHPADRERAEATWRRTWQEGEPYEIEYRLRREDGVYFWFLARAQAVRDDNGEIVEWVGTCTNIDEQKRQSDALGFLSRATALLNSGLDYRKALRKLATLAVAQFADWCVIDLLENGRLERLTVAHNDPDRVALANDLYRRGFSNPQAGLELLERGEPTFYERIDDTVLEQAVRDAEQRQILRSLGLTSSISLPLITRTKRLGVITLIAAESQRLFNFFDRALAERLAERIAVAIENAQLYHELRRFRETLDQALDCVFMFEPQNLCFFYVNQGALDQVGYSRAELLQMTPIDIKPEYNEPQFRQLIAPLLDGTQRLLSFETVHRHKDGHDIPVDLWLQYVATEDEPGRFVAIVRDISERRRAAAALEERNRELDQFAYLISHDLKAPLRGIANLSQWIDEDLGDNVTPEVREHLNLLHGRVQRMEDLINGLLAYARIGRTSGVIEQVRVVDLLAEVIDLLAPPEHVTLEIAPNMPTMKTDHLLLQRVFANLISNAIKHNPGETALVRVGCAREGMYYRFYVGDNGPGIDPSYHERIFGLFQTLVPKDRIESSGIGLALVKRIVEHQNGTVGLESQPGHGATFWFTWPA
ncbi:MAG: PAS domain S-box protein [Oscillochloris sp.]|nr:PAS domain S-box protein [Oscillochloris sp.]